MKRILEYKITTKQDGKLIRDLLREIGFSSQNITDLKKMPESVLLNNKWVYLNQKVNCSDLLTIVITEVDSSEKIVPVPLPLSILYEDEDILVVNKPANMPIHPSINNYENTLANAVMYHYCSKSIPFTFRCLNRLDRDTSGVTLIAKHMLSASVLGNMISNRTIKREYISLVEGTTKASGTINSSIGRVDGSTIERCIKADGDYAVTHYETIRNSKDFSLIKLWLETGRTHQIRVHMKSIGHPLLGDFLYNPKDNLMSRQALHSHRLSFLHPIKKEPLVFEAPLPFDMLTLINQQTTERI